MTGVASVLVAPTAYAQAQNTSLVASAAATAAAVDELTVVAHKEHYRGDLQIKEMPQSVQTLSGRLLTDLNVTGLTSAMDLVSGVARQNSFGGAWDAWAIRGFAGDENVPSGFLVNGFNGGRGFAGPRDVADVERIEILKGPASALFGRGEPGGTVNIITKKPQFTEQGNITLSAGSYQTYRADADITGPLSDSIAGRLSGAYENAHSFRETLKSNKFVFSPSLLVRLGPDTTVTEELYIIKQNLPFDRGIPAFKGVLGAIPNSRFLGEPADGPMKIEAHSNQIEMEHRFNRNWTLLLGFGYLGTMFRGFQEEPEFGASRNPFFVDGQTLARRRIGRDYHTYDYVPRGEISGQINTWGLVHHLLIGADYEDFWMRQAVSRYRPPVYNSTTTLAQLNAVNVFHPVYGLQAPLSPLRDKSEADKTWGVYIHDQIDLTSQLKLSLGVRYDNYKQTLVDEVVGTRAVQADTATSPTVGLVYEPTQEVSLYATYGTGFRPNTGFTAGGVAFLPETTKSYEAGVKYQALDGSLNGTLAVFKTEKTNILTADPVNAGFSMTAGSAASKGVELDVNGKLPGDIRFYAAYSYIEAYYTTTLLDVDFGLLIVPGSPLINIPRNGGNLLVFRDFTVDDKVLTLGAELNYVGSRLGETGTKFTLPAYSLVKLTASYELTPSVKISAEVSNVLNTVYYPSSYAALWVNPGAPRMFNVRASYRF